MSEWGIVNGEWFLKNLLLFTIPCSLFTGHLDLRLTRYTE